MSGGFLKPLKRISPNFRLAEGLCRPRFFLAFCLALMAAVFLCWPTWPGYMSYDPLFAWKESIYGIETSVWPPMQAYLSYLSRTLTGGPGGYFFGQVFILFFSISVTISMYVEKLLAVIALFIINIFIFCFFPTMLGVLGVIWKDVTTASFSLAGLMFWLLAVRFQSWPFLLVAVVSLS